MNEAQLRDVKKFICITNKHFKDGNKWYHSTPLTAKEVDCRLQTKHNNDDGETVFVVPVTSDIRIGG